MSMTRKEFFGTVLKGTAVGALAAGVLAACGGDDGGGDAIDAPAGACTPNATIAGNHGHTLTVSTADVTAGAEKTYDIEGSAGHAHSVTVSAANFTTLAGGGNVNLVSTSGSSHTHNVTVVCA